MHINIPYYHHQLFFIKLPGLSWIWWSAGVIVYLVPILLAIAMLTLCERKVLASMQRRQGPNVVGIFGLLQPIADGAKLLFKEVIMPKYANQIIFIISAFFMFVLSLLNWTFLPLSSQTVIADVNLSTLFFLTISSYGVYGLIFAGWSSNSKYAFLGSVRSAAQLISYEIPFGIIFLMFFTLYGTTKLSALVYCQSNMWAIAPFLPTFGIYGLCILAETNRPPFDLPEAESELVSGYNVEYSAIVFALFFLAEYNAIIMMSLLTALIFFGGWLIPTFITAPFAEEYPIFSIQYFWIFKLFAEPMILISKTVALCFTFIWVRAAWPRVRYDQLMLIAWKVLIPVTFSFLLYLILFLKINHYEPAPGGWAPAPTPFDPMWWLLTWYMK